MTLSTRQVVLAQQIVILMLTSLLVQVKTSTSREGILGRLEAGRTNANDLLSVCLEHRIAMQPTATWKVYLCLVQMRQAP